MSTAWAQDSHYWTNQFGNRARLLGGAVFGSADDLSSVFYNPGALALVDESELLIAGNVFEVTNIKVKDAVGGSDASFWDARLSPSLFAGEIGSKGKGDSRIAYSFLTRMSGKLRMDARAAIRGEDFALPDLEFLSADLRIDTELNEYWLGGTYSHPFGDNAGVGASMFFAHRSQRGRAQSAAQALADDGRAAAAIQARDFSYWHWRVLWKLGLATRLERWRLGITVTTPSLGLGGRGDTSYDDTFVGQAVDEDGNPLTFIATNKQRVSSDFKSPLSIGFGAARTFGDTRLHLAAEWFNETPSYDVLDTEPFQAQSSGEIITTDVVRELDHVFNVAVGLEHEFSEDLQGYGGFRTDFSGLDRNSSANDALTLLDIYHLSGGAIFKMGQTDLTLGGVLAFGTAPVARELAIPAELQESQDVEIRYLRFTFIVGFNFVFK